MTLAATGADLARLNAATAHLEPPFAVVDMAALRANAAAMRRRAAGKPIRLASKSVRCRLVIQQVLRLDGSVAGRVRYERRHRYRLSHG